ncbi:ATP-binding protein [Sorangium sp. So ce1036]|uniref:ATP-binding protein n=1 Tax=Sorangium sp. So ce1036 TaxID=3133328 RepID=UPI003F05E6D8
MIRLRVPGSLTYRHLALRVVAAACKMAAPRRVDGGSPGPTEEEFEAQTVSAFGEAFNNIAIHGYRAGPPGDVDIEIESDADGIIIRLMDTGCSFDPASIESPPIDDLPESGMGLFIIKSFMDEVDYRPGSPNVLRLVKRREGSSCSAGDGSEGDSEQGHTDADFTEAKGHRASSFRMRSVSRVGAARAAGGIKIQ